VVDVDAQKRILDEIGKLGANATVKPEHNIYKDKFSTSRHSIIDLKDRYPEYRKQINQISFKSPESFISSCNTSFDCKIEDFIKNYDWRMWIEVEDIVPAPKKPNLIITVATNKFESLLDYSKPLMEKYAKKCNADFISITGKTQSYWGQEKFRIQKIAANYERIMFLDADLLISDDCPNLFEVIKSDRIGIYNDFNEMSQNIGESNALEWIKKEKRNIIRHFDEKLLFSEFMDYKKILNTGVVIFSKEHLAIFEPITFPFTVTHCTEQTWIDFNIYRHKFQTQELDKEFNTQYWMKYFNKEKNTADVVHFSNCSNKKEAMKNFSFPLIERGNIEDDLVVVTTHFNPMKYKRTVQNYWDWLSYMKGFTNNILTIELSFDGVWETEADVKIRGDKSLHTVFQKEPMINKMIDLVSGEYKYIAWVDHDITHKNKQWLTESYEKLQRGYSILQLFDAWNFLGKDGDVHKKFDGSVMLKKRKYIDCGHPGGAFAGNIEFLRSHGYLYPYMITGGGDSSSLDGWLDRKTFCYDSMDQELTKSLLKWQSIAKRDCVTGYVKGSVDHMYHGELSNRNYEERRIFMKDFNPDNDIFINEDGILEWTGNNKPLEKNMKKYFELRLEDE